MKDNYQEMSQEELIAEIKSLKDIKTEAFQKRDEYKAETKVLAEKFEELSNSHKAILEQLNSTKQLNELEAVSKRIENLNIQEKFKEDLIKKSGITSEMDDKEFNIAVSKTLEEFPEYKQPIQPAMTTIEEDKRDPILERMKQVK